MEPLAEADPTIPEPLLAVGELPVGIALALPRLGASPMLDRAARANAAARAAALARLEGHFPGFDFSSAAQNADDRRFSVLVTNPALLDHLDGVRVVERLINEKQHDLGLGGITFSHGEAEGHLPPPPFAARLWPGGQSARLEVGGLASQLAQQWTMILNGVDRFDPRIGALSSDLMVAFGSRVNTNAYVSYGPAKGFGPHWDTHDTIIVQVHGEKQWSVHNPTVLSAQRPWADRGVSGQEIWRGLLQPGMALFIPRGWGHEVLGSDDLSIHYTIGINRLEVHHLLERVAFEAGMHPLLRADVPFDLRAPIESYGGSPLDDPNGLGREIADLVTPELVDRGVAAYRARLEMRRFPSLVATFRAVGLDRWDDVRIRIPSTGGLAILQEDASGVTFGLDDRALAVASPALDAFLTLADAAPRRLDELPAVVVDGEDQRRRLVRDLLAANVAVVDSTM